MNHDHLEKVDETGETVYLEGYHEGHQVRVEVDRDAYYSEDEPDEEPDEEPEAHVCDTCGDEFDSDHGLTVHRGRAHGDDE